MSMIRSSPPSLDTTSGKIYEKIKYEPFLQSLEKTIYDTLKNSSEINDTLLEIEVK